MTEADLTAGAKKLTVIGGKLGGSGYEPTIKPEKAPDSYKMDARDSMLIFWPEEINDSFTVAPQGYTTPAFDGKHAANEFTSQDQMMAFLQKMDKSSDVMHLYSAGTTRTTSMTSPWHSSPPPRSPRTPRSPRPPRSSRATARSTSGTRPRSTPMSPPPVKARS